MKRPAEPKHVEINSRAEWRNWLSENHTQKDSIWMVIWKKPDPRHVPWGDIVQEALCFGWVDSQPAKLDDRRSMLRLSPRKPKSAWSGINKAHVARLTAAGLMHPAGLAMVQLAKDSGTWDQLNTATNLDVPDDLKTAFADHPGSAEHFEAFPKSVRRAILEWITTAKKPETRAARVDDTASKAAQNERANQWRKG